MARIPFIGGGKERMGAVVSLEPFPTVPKSDEQRESIVALWSMGKTPIDEVEDQLIRQFPGMDAEQLASMVAAVEVKRGLGKKAGC